MTTEELRQRTLKFGWRIIRLVNSLPKNDVGRVISKQIMKSGSSVGANYWSACRSRTYPDFLSRMSIAQEEGDETIYWLNLLIMGKVVPEDKIGPLLQEANELVAIFAASIKTARKNMKPPLKNKE